MSGSYVSDGYVSGRATWSASRLWGFPFPGWYVLLGAVYGVSRSDGIDPLHCDTFFSYDAVIDDFGNLVRVQ